jgi:hypothetical protein
MTARIDERTTGLDRTLHDLLKIEPLAAQFNLAPRNARNLQSRCDSSKSSRSLSKYSTLRPTL